MEALTNLQTEETILHAHLGRLVEILEWAAAIVDVFAILILLIGAIRFIVGVTIAEISRDGQRRTRGVNRERMELGRYILAGLELFIVSDVVHTALSLKFADLLFLLLLVIIRSIISYFLDRELAQLKDEVDVT